MDDKADNLRLLQSLLTQEGYTVRAVPNGKFALSGAQSIVPDLILLDIKMPGMDGYEVCRKLKEDERTRAVPIIFLSALHQTEDIVKGFEAGGVDYVTKPFNQHELLA